MTVFNQQKSCSKIYFYFLHAINRRINNGRSSTVELAECFYIFLDAINRLIYNGRCNTAVLTEWKTIFSLKIVSRYGKSTKAAASCYLSVILLFWNHLRPLLLTGAGRDNNLSASLNDPWFVHYSVILKLRNARYSRL